MATPTERDAIVGFEPHAVRSAYEAMAADYATTFADDLLNLELDRSFRDDLARAVAGRGCVLDLGCGPAQVGRYLADRHSTAVGVDLAPGVLAATRARLPVMPLAAADLHRLPFADRSCAGAAALYVVHNLPRSHLPMVLSELHRVLTAAGTIVVATHSGAGEFGVAGHDVRGTLYPADELQEQLSGASFRVERVGARGPLAHEHQGDRAYVLATATGS